MQGWRSWEDVGIKVTGAEMNATIDAMALPRNLPGEDQPVSLLDLGYTDVAIVRCLPAALPRVLGSRTDKQARPRLVGRTTAGNQQIPCQAAPTVASTRLMAYRSSIRHASLEGWRRWRPELRSTRR